ncbi:MAG: hypothetical protein RSA99_01870, partial [Oscillospiraceae bacterium]
SFVFFSVIAFNLTGCTGDSTKKVAKTAYPTSVLNITIERKPNAVASLSPSITNILIDLGYKENIVGYSSDFVADGIIDNQRIGTALIPDLEKISVMKTPPEIIFTNVPIEMAKMTKLSQIGVKVLVMPNIKNVAELETRYTQIIKAMEGEIEGTNYGVVKGKEIGTQIEQMKNKVKTPKTFIYITQLDPIIATGDTVESELLQTFGTNLAASERGYSVSLDKLKAMQPDVIFFANSINPENIKQSANFKDKTAVKNGALIPVDNAKLTLQKGTAFDALQEIGKSVFPDISFKDETSSQASTSSTASK